MKLTCPNCQEPLTLAALIEQDAAREAVRMALEFPAPLGKQVLQYVTLFKPEKSALSIDRFAKILKELLPMIKAGQVERNGRIWPAPQAYWAQAFEIMWASRTKLKLPLKSHGYFLEILVGLSDKAEAVAETKAEQGRQYGTPKNAVAAPANLMPVMTKTPQQKSKPNYPVAMQETLRNMKAKVKKNGN